MMQKLKEEITAAANRELNRANEQFPLFTSKHEGVAVAYEELEESKEALEELEASFKCLWDDVRGKETPCYLKEEITPLKIADYAINLACEAVQTAAMLMKYEMSLNPAAGLLQNGKGSSQSGVNHKCGQCGSARVLHPSNDYREKAGFS